ncbi:AMP-binding protein [Paracraurococcus ruber]|uniref:Long-chain fatty acid--CoA ligase n=1 Tax=Paracraurococcus ruber TaxID=77675 RepID=A0ABS1CS54_9PROT|nr:AMP-binding protein [Paracraurococcus ruber]MBK1657204.1 long-chain fatty acid--CoA ligase [Paracraurococcus ruber]TDG32554.1 long-chain fatty acid--CoA ligase [Paracraurococcus ruber]
MSPILTLGEALRAQARLQPERIGARDLDRAMSFALWNARACRLANALTGLGLARGDRVAVLAHNRIEWVEIYAAAAKAGLVAVPVNFRLVGPEIRYILEDSGAAALIAEDVLLGAVEAIGADLPVPRDRLVLLGGARVPAGWRGYEDLLAAAAETEPAVPVAPGDPWCLMYTSGTTGNPKGAIRGHRGMAMLALMTEVEFGLRRRDGALLVMPMCHANSLNFFSAFLYAGAPVNILSRASFDPELCLRTLAETGASFTSLVPTHYQMMLDSTAARARAGALDRVEKLLISSAPARIETKRAVMAMFPRSGLFELYGSTEAGWVTMLHPEEQFDHAGSVGREVVGSAPVRLLDEAGEEVPDGMPGELYSCGPYAFDGYWNLPGKTAEAFRSDYLTVGDVAVREAGGYIRLLDRKKNMIITGGENVYPTEVETVLATHPGVRDVAVIGLPDARWGERVHAVVVPRDGAGLTEDALLDWCRGRMAGHKRPRGMSLVAPDDIPRNATGKVLHRVLRERLVQQG